MVLFSVQTYILHSFGVIVSRWDAIKQCIVSNSVQCCLLQYPRTMLLFLASCANQMSKSVLLVPRSISFAGNKKTAKELWTKKNSMIKVCILSMR